METAQKKIPNCDEARHHVQPNTHLLDTLDMAMKVTLKMAERESLTAKEQSKELVNFCRLLCVDIVVITKELPKREIAIIRKRIELVM